MRAKGLRVPPLVGLAVDEAHDVALDAGVLAVEVDSGRRYATGDRSACRVRDQRPRPGRRVMPGAHIHIWITRPGPEQDGGDGHGGGGGDRSPVGPRPVVLSRRS